MADGWVVIVVLLGGRTAVVRQHYVGKEESHMNRRTLGPGGPEVSEIGLGCMGMLAFYGTTDADEVHGGHPPALELGCDFLDTSDMYGPGTPTRNSGAASLAGPCFYRLARGDRGGVTSVATAPASAMRTSRETSRRPSASVSWPPRRASTPVQLALGVGALARGAHRPDPRHQAALLPGGQPRRRRGAAEPRGVRAHRRRGSASRSGGSATTRRG